MAKYRVQGPDGATHVFEGPDNATEEQVLAAAQQQFGQQQEQPSRSLFDRITTGIGDLGRGALYGGMEAIGGAAQLGARGLESATQAGNQQFGDLARSMQAKGMPVLDPAQAAAQATRDRVAAEEANRSDERMFRQDWMDGRDTTAADIGRVAGGIAATLPLTYALPGARAATIPGKIGAGALAGGVSGAMQPVSEGDYWPEKRKQLTTGAVTGGVASGLLGLASKAMQGSSNPALRELADSGVRPTPGQAMGGAANTAEQKMMSAPLLGDMIRSGRNRAIDQFDRATINKVLKPIGEKIDDSAPLTRETIDDVASKVSDAYDNLLPKLTLKADNQFLSEVQNLRTLAQNLPPEMAATFNKTLKTQVLDNVAQSGQMTGETMKAVESELGRLRTLYGRSALGSEQELGRAIGELQSVLRTATERSNPMFKGKLAANNKAYALLKRLEGATAYVGGESGKFSPNQLVSAVKAADKSRGKSSFARGNALMQDWAEGGKQVLGNTVPDSGTAGRIAMNAGTGAALAGGTALLSPYIAGAGLLGIPYAPLLRDLPGYLAKSPNAYGKLGSTAVNALTPAAAYGAPIGYGLLNY